ncbi:MAG: C40 family peptidase, partial [Proteobacteria bacterium]|nr:C40 family peptidase [Pseudomonadota bacterium]
MRVIAAALLLLVAGCAATPPRPEAADGLGARAASLAARLIGAPYRAGGSGPRAFDCSGLVVYVYG